MCCWRKKRKKKKTKKKTWGWKEHFRGWKALLIQKRYYGICPPVLVSGSALAFSLNSHCCIMGGNGFTKRVKKGSRKLTRQHNVTLRCWLYGCLLPWHHSLNAIWTFPSVLPCARWQVDAPPNPRQTAHPKSIAPLPFSPRLPTPISLLASAIDYCGSSDHVIVLFSFFPF